MASVESRTRISIDELVNDTIVSGHVTSSGILILTTRGGAEINAGFLAAQPIRENWSHTSLYRIGDLVGYAGVIWRAVAENTNKVPYFYTNYWTRLTGDKIDEWVELDPYFDGNNIGDAWNSFWATGSTSFGLTSVAGEYETGIQGSKVVVAAGASQVIIPNIENIISNTDDVVVSVRVKLLSATPTATIDAQLLQNDQDNWPDFFQPGASISPSIEGPVTPTTSFETYTFHITPDDLKPRSRLAVFFNSVATGATFFVDSIRVNQSSGSAGTAEYVQETTFASAATTWVITHGQGTKGLSVYTEDTLGNEIRGDVSYPDDNTIHVTFFHAQTGKARVFS